MGVPIVCWEKGSLLLTQSHKSGDITVPLAFIIGMVGAGKSLFTAAFSEWLKMSKQDVAVVNLDPGA